MYKLLMYKLLTVFLVTLIGLLPVVSLEASDEASDEDTLIARGGRGGGRGGAGRGGAGRRGPGQVQRTPTMSRAQRAPVAAAPTYYPATPYYYEETPQYPTHP